jgi:hypothetical protein
VCHQSVGLIARVLEDAGVPTVTMTSARSITERVNPPRAVFIDLPLGHTSGPPNDPVGQRQLLTDALVAGFGIEKPGTIVDLPFRWIDDAWKAAPLSWSRTAQDSGTTGTDAGDTRNHRSEEPYYHDEADRAAAAAVPWEDQRRVCLGLSEPSE